MMLLLLACVPKKQAPPAAIAQCRALDPPPPPTLGLEPAFGDARFDHPVELVPGPNGLLYVLEQPGVVKTIDPETNAVATFLDLHRDVTYGGEAGLLGIAFDETHLYLHYDRPKAGVVFESAIVRFSMSDLSQRETILTLDQPFANHNGGRIAFGPDGMLYIGFGDGGSGGDPNDNGQNKGVLLGKILRVEPDGSVPPDNPFGNAIWAYGLRNPWKLSFDRATGKLYAGDVGQNAYEEVDEIVRGGNYGWRVREGFHCFNPMRGCATTGFIEPLVEYSHSEGISITGGYVYRGTALPRLVGKYVYGDFGSGKIWALDLDALTTETIVESGLQISSFGEDEQGELYVLDYATGRISKIAETAGGGGSVVPTDLKDTGCLDAALTAYDVRVPLWSDGADKSRAYAGELTVHDDGDTELPPGGVVVKTFSKAGEKIETRLFVRHNDGTYAGYSYEWRGDRATLLGGGKTTDAWIFPSRTQCMECHTEAAGFTLGLETRQVPALGSGDPLPQDARGYLHANCSNCHRPGNVAGRADMNLLVTASIEEMKVCDVAPKTEDLGIQNARLVAPGDPARSLIVARMSAASPAEGRMPPLASQRVDDAGVKLVADWIAALPDCRLH